MRGEHCRACSYDGAHQGSSPHARGAPEISLPKVSNTGIIPACAGSTLSRPTAPQQNRDHPRMRGEHVCAEIVPSRLVGSSPHARGARLKAVDPFSLKGIIPACAGSTRKDERSVSNVRDHPRMRGEHDGKIVDADKLTGSSPHARGARMCRPKAKRRQRIIPACAGSTAPGLRLHPWYRDHPRMRGEHWASVAGRVTLTGSSPHARGAHFTTSASGRHSRLIHSLFASSGHPSGLSSDYIFARRDTCWHCSNPWRAHRQVSRHQCRSVGG